MTTIAYRNGIMAADSRAYAGSKIPIGTKLKITACDVEGVPFLVGVSTSSPGFGEMVLNWFAAGHNVHDGPPIPDGGFTLLAVDAAGQGYYANDAWTLSGPLTADWWAIGSGDGYAIGALAMGASAYEAVKIACANDPWTGGAIHTLSFDIADGKISGVTHIQHDQE